MNPTSTQPEATTAKPVLDRDLLAQIVEEMEAANPYGLGKYTDEDATILGLPSLGSLRLANTLVKQWLGSPFIPKFIANSPNPAGTFVACVVQGNELGFKMMESLKALFQAPDGRLGMYGTAMLALMRKSKFKLTFTPGEDGYKVHGLRPDGDEYTATFTHVDAVRAKLYKADSNHEKYPLTMCKWRAVSDLFRTLASDLSAGPLYTAEELIEETGGDRGGERGDGSNAVFAEHAKRAPNPFSVGEVPVDPVETKPAAPEAATAKPEPEPPAAETVQTTVKVESTLREVLGEALRDAEAKDQEPQPVNGAPTPAPGPTLVPDPTPAGLKPLKELTKEMTDLYPKLSPETVTKKIHEFFKGFLNVKTLPKGGDADAKYRLMFRFVEAMLKDYAQKFIENPHGSGMICGVNYLAFQKTMEDWHWSGRCAQLATDLMFKYNHVDSGGKDTSTWFQDIKIDNLAEVDVYAFLTVALRTRDAYMLVEQWESSKVPISKIVAGWGTDVATAPVEGIEALLKGGKVAKAAEPAKVVEMPKEPVAEPAKAEDDIQSILDLFE
jgi:hypothetical protein